MVFYASFSLSAILILILFIGTRVSDLDPWIEVGADLELVEAGPAALGGAAAATGAAATGAGVVATGVAA